MASMIYPGGEHPARTNYIRKLDSVQFIVDHVGMGVDRAARPDHLNSTIDQVLAYAKYPTWPSNGDVPGSGSKLSRTAT
jgi:hypothetical protein